MCWCRGRSCTEHQGKGEAEYEQYVTTTSVGPNHVTLPPATTSPDQGEATFLPRVVSAVRRVVNPALVEPTLIPEQTEFVKRPA
jgi:hypothetical protein